MMKSMGFKTQKEAADWLNNNKITLHHQNNTTVLLIPTDLHGNIPHIGSASDMRNN